MLTRGDFENVTKAVLEEIADAPDPAAYSLRVTSGTMQGSPVLVARRRTVPGLVPPYDYCPGAKAVVTFHGPVSARFQKLCEFILDYEAADRRMLIVGAEDLNENFGALMGAFRPDGFAGLPAFILRALEYVRDPVIRAGIKVFGVYDTLTDDAEKFLRAEFPHARIVDTYGMGEAAALGNNACGFLPRGCFHPNPWVSVEVVDPDESGAGDFVLSFPQSRTVQVERYQNGDRARMISAPCRCGEKITFELLGRKEGNVVKIAGALLFREEFDRVSRSLGDYILDYRAKVREYFEHGQPRAALELEIVPTPLLRTRPDAEAFLARAFAEQLYATPTQTLAQLIQQGIFALLTVTLVAPFPPYAKEVKLTKVSHGDRSSKPLL